MSQPAQGMSASVDRCLAELRAQGWTWNNCRCGIVARTPRNRDGKGATTIWYGMHEVSTDMILQRPTPPRAVRRAS